MDEAELDVAHVAPLEADSVPDTNQAHYCFSCEAPITGLYCVKCGQKNDNLRRSIFSLGLETLNSLTAFESRIWRTWAALLMKPGKVAREYADGARTRWSSPVRVYLAMSLLLFGFMSVFQINIISFDVDVRAPEGATQPIESLPVESLKTVGKVHFFERRSVYDARMEGRRMDLIAKKLRLPGFDVDLGNMFGLDDQDVAEIADAQRAANEPTGEPEPASSAVTDSPQNKDQNTPQSTANALDEVMVEINNEVIDPSDISELGLRFLQNPATLNAGFQRYLPRLMFFMMPITMLLGAMFIRGRGNALLYDHLVHASYVHAVTYLALFIAIVGAQIMPGVNLGRWLLLAVIVYLPLSARGMFKRGWIKTIWTSYGVGFIYLLIIFTLIALLVAYQIKTQLEVVQAQKF